MKDIKEKLIDKLDMRGVHRTSTSGIQHYTRCPYCGDSLNLNHAHFSIKIVVDDDTVPLMYRCLRCGESGMLSNDVLSDLGIPFTGDDVVNFKTYMKRSAKLGKYKDTPIENYTIPAPSKTVAAYKKLDYINQRLGTDLSFDDVMKYKMVLSVKDFLIHNEIFHSDEFTCPGVTDKTLEMLEREYVGFLAANNNVITFRSINPNNKLRYYKLLINARNVNRDSFYSIPFEISLLYTHPVSINICEGIFDILSVDKNLNNDDMLNINVAICGFGGNNLLKYMMKLGINTNIDLNVYCDADKSDNLIRNVLFRNGITLDLYENVYFHRNGYDNEKDYGVPKDRMIDTKRKIM